MEQSKIIIKLEKDIVPGICAQNMKKEKFAEIWECNLDSAFGNMIMDRYLEIISDDTKRDMIFIGKESASYKLGNIK